MTKTRITWITVLLAAMATLPCGASAQDWPSKPVKVIVPFAGGIDARHCSAPRRRCFAARAQRPAVHCRE